MKKKKATKGEATLGDLILSNKKSISPSLKKIKRLQHFAEIAAGLSAYHLNRVVAGQPEATFHFCQFLEAISLESYFLQLAHFHQRKIGHDY